METRETNDFMTLVGPGQPAGDLLRRYWMPVAVAQELTDENPTKFVRLLGEDLVLFKDKSGRVGLLADHCSHRSASLVYGRVEERGIACAYHGWLYDCEGNILETPPERNDRHHALRQAEGVPRAEGRRPLLGVPRRRRAARHSQVRRLGAQGRTSPHLGTAPARLQLARRHGELHGLRATRRSFTRAAGRSTPREASSTRSRCTISTSSSTGS